MWRRKLKTLTNIIKFKIQEKSYHGVKYLYYADNKDCDTLLISFSAMPPTNVRLYNNVKGFSKLPVDRLYISDMWGYRGSYYMYENGELTPYSKTCALIEKIIQKKKYKNIITCGTSKGGSAAIIYGLKYNAQHIFAGACQYYIGSYLSVPCHLSILHAMSGSMPDQTIINELNNLIPTLITDTRESNNSTIHLNFSKKEHTYDEHIKYLIQDLEKNGKNIILKEYDFVNHNDVGIYYLQYINEWFNQKH